MAETNIPRVGLGVMILKDGKALVGKRISRSHGAGEYCFPGGWLEHLESFEDGIRREVLEECGITLKNIRFQVLINMRTYAPLHSVTIGFVADHESGEPALLEPDKFSAWQWADPDRLPEPLFAASRLIADAYKKGYSYIDKA